MESSEMSSEGTLNKVLATFPSTDVTITNLNYIIDLFLEYLLREKNGITQNEVILKWLIEWLQNTSSISWNIAHRILHVISTIITQSNNFLHSEDILWILDQVVQLNYETDISNRAELLKMLMLTLSQEKLKKTFVQTSEFSESTVSEISLNSTIVRKAPLNISKLPYCYSTITYLGKNDAGEYLKYIEDVASKQPVAFCLQLELSPSNEHDLQALILMLAVAEGFGNFEPVLVGHIKVEEKQCTTLIRCQLLRIPYPSVCNVRAEFTVRNRLMSCDLPPLHFTFSDFFRQLPISETQRTAIFSDLWKLLVSKGAIQSFFLLELKCEDVKKKLDTKLSPFIVNRSEDEENQPMEVCIAVYLPPGKHLLCTFFIDESCTKVTILTESTYILSSVNTFLNNF